VSYLQIFCFTSLALDVVGSKTLAGEEYNRLVRKVKLLDNASLLKKTQCLSKCWYNYSRCKFSCINDYENRQEAHRKEYFKWDIYFPPTCYLNPQIPSHAARYATLVSKNHRELEATYKSCVNVQFYGGTANFKKCEKDKEQAENEWKAWYN
jgi:hypothetical protein